MKRETLLVLLIAVACTDARHAATAPQLAATRTHATSDTDWVTTPRGLMRRHCVTFLGDDVEYMDNLAFVVHYKNGKTKSIERCLGERRPSIEPTISGYVETAELIGYLIKEQIAYLKVPADPVDTTNGDFGCGGCGTVYFTFPGVTAPFSGHNARIFQPVLQFGDNGIVGVTNKWGWTDYWCGFSNCSYGSAIYPVSGDSLIGTVKAENCSGGTYDVAVCDWHVVVNDVTQNKSVEKVWHDSGTISYNRWTGSAVEVYNVTDCDQFPAHGVFYSSVSQYDTGYHLLSSTWGIGPPSQNNIPNCSFSATATNGTSSVQAMKADSASYSARFTKGGLYDYSNYRWIVGLTGTGNKLTVTDSYGDTSSFTASGMTVSGSGWINTNSTLIGVTASGNTITITDSQLNTGTISLSGLTLTGPGIDPSYGYTITSITTGQGGQGIYFTIAPDPVNGCPEAFLGCQSYIAVH